MAPIVKAVKFYPAFQKKIDILLINHEEQSCIELIVLGIKAGNKATRLYLDSAILVTKIDIKQFNVTFEIKQKAATRQNSVFDYDLEMKRIVFNMITTMIIQRLQITPSADLRNFEVFFESTQEDSGYITSDENGEISTRMDFELLAKPHGLMPYKEALRLSNLKTFPPSKGSQSPTALMKKHKVAPHTPPTKNGLSESHTHQMTRESASENKQKMIPKFAHKNSNFTQLLSNILHLRSFTRTSNRVFVDMR